MLLVVVEVVASKTLQHSRRKWDTRPASEHRHKVSDTHLGPQSTDPVVVLVSYETAMALHVQVVRG